MNFYNVQHQYYCGIDLHAKSMYLCILDNEGKKLVHRNIRTEPGYFLKVLEPYREDVVVGVECMFSWYWVSDLCVNEGIDFTLGHCLYMKAIHGGKSKNDKIDSEKIAVLLRGGMFPTAYVYPRKMRSARDLMRRRIYFCRRRADLVRHVQIARIQYNMPEFKRPIRNRYGNTRADIINYFEDPYVRKSIEADTVTIDHYDLVLKELEREILKAGKYHDAESLRVLLSVHGIGNILALTILYEIQTIERFPRVQDFLSYCRLIKCKKESAGKSYGTSGKKIGNAYLKWAFSEAAALFKRNNEPAKRYCQRLESKHGKGKAMGILSRNLATAVYYMLKRKRSFDQEKFLNR